MGHPTLLQPTLCQFPRHPKNIWISCMSPFWNETPLYPAGPQSPMRQLCILQDPKSAMNPSVPCRISGSNETSLYPAGSRSPLRHLCHINVPNREELLPLGVLVLWGSVYPHYTHYIAFLFFAPYWTKWDLLCSHLFWWWVQSCTGNEQMNILKRGCDLKGCYLLNAVLALSAEGSESVTSHSEGEKVKWTQWCWTLQGLRNLTSSLGWMRENNCIITCEGWTGWTG